MPARTTFHWPRIIGWSLAIGMTGLVYGFGVWFLLHLCGLT